MLTEKGNEAGDVVGTTNLAHAYVKGRGATEAESERAFFIQKPLRADTLEPAATKV